jgi:trans-aconitate 2-methyltransferase
LHWINDHSTFLTGAYHALKKGGLLRVNFAADGNCSTFIRIVKSAMQIAEYRAYFLNFEWPWYMPKLEQYEKIIKQTPFREVKVWGENRDRFFPDAESITKWIDQPSLVPFRISLQLPQRENFRDFVVRNMLKAARQDDGTYYESFRRINVSALR